MMIKHTRAQYTSTANQDLDCPGSSKTLLKMNPFKSGSTVICINESSLAALMSTAVVLTAAATYWCTRRFRTMRVIERVKEVAAVAVSDEKNHISRPTTSSPSIPTEALDLDPSLSFLCTSCGTEKYSNEQVSKVSKSSGPYKMVVLVRTDLNMGKGKAAAQCCHAVLAAFKSATFRQPDALKRWEREGQPKVTLKIDSETELIELMQKARSAGLPAESIKDAGRTQVVAGTRTVCAIGPGPAKLIDTITGHLKLY